MINWVFYLMVFMIEEQKEYTWENLKRIEDEWIEVSKEVKKLKEQLNYI